MYARSSRDHDRVRDRDDDVVDVKDDEEDAQRAIEIEYIRSKIPADYVRLIF